MKKSPVLLFLHLSFCLISSRAETFYGPGSISVATNETILITTLGGQGGGWDCSIDGQTVSLRYSDNKPYRYAISGPHTFGVTGISFVTFQRLQGSSVRTLILNGGTNYISISAGKTAQFFQPMTGYLGGKIQAIVHPEGSTNSYSFLDESGGYPHPSVSGSAVVEVSGFGAVSYYLTDDILQLPPQGFLQTPALTLEVNIEKSYDLTNWIPTGTFNTEAEAGAFYRLRMLK